ncbi:MAG: AraC family transcriptional regulator [Gammaproteobacteria bacterium]|nr:AraC family transcriptional regulator [Gammaproteobacteria bacterium]MDH5801578.1 AraC family transcriptional regulator [Gammaproteobacteria bacterium]
MVEHRNTTATVRMVLKACESAGVDTDELLQLAAIERQTALHPDGEVTFVQMRDFWQNAFRLSGDPFLGMRAAQHVEMGDFKCLDYLSANAATLGQCLESFCRYMPLLNTWIAWEIAKDDHQVTYRMLSHAGVIPPHSYEFVFSVYVKRAREVSHTDWAPALIRFPFPKPADQQQHLSFFRSPIEYDCPAGELVLSKEHWKLPLPYSDEHLMRVLDEHARLLLAQRPIPEDFVGRVRREIVRELHGGEALRDTIAKKLHMSPRTLQRRLDENGIAYADLLDEVRADLAKNKLQACELSLTEIGFLLGFSEQSAFTRAFKRWTGKTPLEYRRLNSTI